MKFIKGLIHIIKREEELACLLGIDINNKPMKQFGICVGIFIALSMSRFIPHPPNFTSLIALSFYVPVLLGIRFLPALLISFAITDFIIGYHTGTHWTWGSVLIIGLISRYLSNSIFLRMGGALFGAFIFYLVTNFGVWTGGMYGYSFTGLMNSYILAIPFFGYSLISTFLFSAVIETCYFFSQSFFKKKI